MAKASVLATPAFRNWRRSILLAIAPLTSLVLQHLALEVELQRKLNLAEGKGYRTGDRTETRNRSTRCARIAGIPAEVRRRTELRLVQEIKRLHPELQRLGFS